MDKLPQISEAEYEIMKIIWDESPISTNSICEKVPSIHNWSNKTVHTLLSRLVSKHVISYEQKGRIMVFTFCSTVPMSWLTRMMARSLLISSSRE